MAALAILAYVLIIAIGAPLIWIVAHHSPKKYKNLITLDRKRYVIECEMKYDYDHADFITRWRFRKHLKKGGRIL